MYMSGRVGSDPRAPTAIIETALLPPRATTAPPSIGSSATSTSSPPSPTAVPAASGPSESSGAPMTTLPSIGSAATASAAAENAACSASGWFARPSQRAPARAAASVTRT
jgi:hypothetical protein